MRRIVKTSLDARMPACPSGQACPLCLSRWTRCLTASPKTHKPALKTTRANVPDQNQASPAYLASPASTIRHNPKPVKARPVGALISHHLRWWDSRFSIAFANGIARTLAWFNAPYTNNKTSVSTIPPIVQYIPLRKMSLLGRNIQKLEITKNSSEKPKKMFRK